MAIERTTGVALPSVDTDDRHTAEVDPVNDAVLQRYGVRATVRCSLFHGDPRDGVVERVHVLELHGGAALEWRPARALLSDLVGHDRRALEQLRDSLPTLERAVSNSTALAFRTRSNTAICGRVTSSWNSRMARARSSTGKMPRSHIRSSVSRR